MARFTRKVVSQGDNSWESDVNTNLQNILSKPFVVPVHSGDETDLESTFAAAQHDNAIIWVNHTTLGWVLYHSNNVAWNVILEPRATRVTWQGLRSSGTETLSGTEFTVAWPTEDINDDTSVFTLSSGELTVNLAGRYEISCHMCVEDTGVTRATMFMQLDTGSGFSELTATRCFEGGATRHNMSFRILLDLGAGDDLRIRARSLSGVAPVLRDGMVWTVRRVGA